MSDPVLTKSAFYARWNANEFGNRLGVWRSIEEAEADGFKGPTFGIRCTVPGWKHFEMLIPWAERHKHWAWKIKESGTPENLLRCCEDDGGQEAILQGHLYRPDRLILEHTDGIRNLRDAYKAGFSTVSGLAAHMMLRSKLDPCDYEWLMELLDLYPDHVIEFTSYPHPVGLLRRCMVVWEVRKY